MWKQFQAKAKPLLSPKLGARDPDDKKEERSLWMFKKMKRKGNAALDRVISSSQPDLICASRLDLETKEDHGSGKAACSSGSGSGVGREKTSHQRFPSPKTPTVAQLVLSHHKSSSLGSACLERLAEAASGSGSGSEAAAAAAATGTQLEAEEDQPVSFCQFNVPGCFRKSNVDSRTLLRLRKQVTGCFTF